MRPLVTPATARSPEDFYDSDCGFCTRSAELVGRWGLGPAQVRAYQELELEGLGLSLEECERAVQWIEPGQPPRAAARAVAALLHHSQLPWPLLGAVLDLPGVAWVAARVYRLVAANRYRLPGGSGACALPRTPPPAPENTQGGAGA